MGEGLHKNVSVTIFVYLPKQFGWRAAYSDNYITMLIILLCCTKGACLPMPHTVTCQQLDIWNTYSDIPRTRG